VVQDPAIYNGSDAFYWLNELAKPEFAPFTFRSYYVGTVSPYDKVPDFKNRVIRVNKDTTGDYVDDVPVANPEAQNPVGAKVGDKTYWSVLPGKNKIFRPVGMTLQADGGWKVNPTGTITVGI
ncbi:MAG: hypothetical protein IT348_00745, partial [Candidatus Eisenbacteria bacterium]|nr:hypothetical protein [Candidatus Eisenbacteria bacterium]